MKNYNPTYIRVCTAYLFFLTAFLISSCQVDTKHDDGATTRAGTKPLVDPKYSLIQDRSEFDQLRGSIPENKRIANDEKALLTQWMIDFKKSPSEVRDKFDTLVRKKRDLFNKDMTKVRETYTKKKETERKAFLKDLENQRAEFSNQKKNSSERSEFFNSMDEKRRDYFTAESEKREEFESEMKDQRKNFEDYMNEKRLDFTSEMKSYSEKWNAIQTEQKK